MKRKNTLAALAFIGVTALGMPMVANAQTDYSPTADKEVFDFSGFTDMNMLELFYNALQQGRNYPTLAEFEAKGILPSDIAFIRSHVRMAKIMDRSDRVNQNAYKDRNFWANIPMSLGKDGAVGQPSSNFADDVYSMWNYTNLFGSWNHGVFSAPGCWVDAAHKNGTAIFSGIKFSDHAASMGSWGSAVKEKNPDGTYKYVKPIINCLMYFGADGINYNWERDHSYLMPISYEFHKALYKEAAAQGFDNFHMGLYTTNASVSSSTANALFGSKESGRTADLMLNYYANDVSQYIPGSVAACKQSMGTADGLYAGVWIASMDRDWHYFSESGAEECGVCVWGEHAASRFWTFNAGDDSYDAQSNYQALLERAFSGGNRNPLKRPTLKNTGNNWRQEGNKEPLQTFAGFAEWIPERSGIQGNLPFMTNFNLGNGDRYTYKGKKTAGAWYNMANQDVVPTYRWLVVKPGTMTVSTDIQPEFTHLDSYTGGSCLKLSGKATSAGTDVVLYKTNLNVSASNPYVKIAVKNRKEGKNASNLYVIVRNKAGQWLETPVGDLDGKTWQEKKISLAGISQSDVIERIGLRVKGDDANYEMYVGKLEVNDDVKATPADIKDLQVEVKKETKESLTAKLYWGVNAEAKSRAAWDLVYNDEANIAYFEVLYKNGENGRVQEVTRTTQWSALVNNIMFESTADKPFVGVRAVSTDLKTYSPVHWVEINRADQSKLPEFIPENTYGISQLDPNSDGLENARKCRYVTQVTTTGGDVNINYSANAPKDTTNYVDATDQLLKVKQGSKVTIFIKCCDSQKAGVFNNGQPDGLRWCFAGCWMDLDGNGKFGKDPIDENPTEGERIFKLGKDEKATPEFETEGITHTFTIPTDAAPGKSRMRIVFADAWFKNTFLPTGYTAKGFSIDFSVEITGDNPARPHAYDPHDEGQADEPENMGTDGITNVSHGVSSFDVVNGNINFQNVEKAWIYGVDGTLVKYVKNPSSLSTNSFAKGVYLVKMQNGNILRSQKFTVK